MNDTTPEEQLAVITADRDAWCERAAELIRAGRPVPPFLRDAVAGILSTPGRLPITAWYAAAGLGGAA